MEESTMEKNPAETQMMHIAASGMTTMYLSGQEPTSDSTGSDNERSEFTTTVSRSHIRCILDEMTEEHANQLLSDFSALWKLRIVEELAPGICRVSMMNSSSGSIGHSAEEAEH